MLVISLSCGIVPFAYFKSKRDKPSTLTVLTIFAATVCGDPTKSAPSRASRSKWSGPIGVYPEAGREDYIDPSPDPADKNDITPAEFLDLARKWVQDGVQIIGGCCGIGPEYIRPLRDGLPGRVPARRR